MPAAPAPPTAAPATPLSASDLWALIHSAKNGGPDRCHWCCSPAQRTWVHDDDPPVPFQRSKSTARNPSGCYVCVGCWLFRRGSVTVNYFDGGLEGKVLKDRQQAKAHSWLVTEEGATAIRTEQDGKHLYPFLLKPPRRFFLALREGPKAPETLLQLCEANDVLELKADTPLAFTVNNVRHHYTVYELESALRSPEVVGGPGVQALRRVLGPYELPAVVVPLPEVEGKRGRGRPTDTIHQREFHKKAAWTSSQAVVTASGK